MTTAPRRHRRRLAVSDLHVSYSGLIIFCGVRLVVHGKVSAIPTFSVGLVVPGLGQQPTLSQADVV
jgi:hypothetical protein